jgi:hypothetical protein
MSTERMEMIQNGIQGVIGVILVSTFVWVVGKRLLKALRDRGSHKEMVEEGN